MDLGGHVGTLELKLVRVPRVQQPNCVLLAKQCVDSILSDRCVGAGRSQLAGKESGHSPRKVIKVAASPTHWQLHRHFTLLKYRPECEDPREGPNRRPIKEYLGSGGTLARMIPS